MDALDMIKDWGGWLFGGLAAIVTWRKSGDDRIDDRIKAVAQPKALSEAVARIEDKVDSLHDGMSEIRERVARIEGRDEAYMRLPSPSAQRVR
jgi:hypothetical protein